MKKSWLFFLVVILAGCSGAVEAQTEQVDEYKMETETEIVMQEEKQHWTDYHLVAHALGGIDGHRYTNSAEGFKLAYEKGFRVFEIDFILTRDDKLVARHHWDDAPIKHIELMTTKIEGKYTPLDVDGVYNLLSQYDDAYLILDFKANDDDGKHLIYEIITSTFDDDVLKRTIPQLQFESDLSIAKEYYDFSDYKYTLYRTDATDQEVVEFAKENDITAVVMSSKKRYNADLVQELLKHGILSYVHTINDEDEINSYLDAGVHGIYTDFVVP